MSKSVERAKVVGVVGLGKTGQSCIEYLLRIGCHVLACDTRLVVPHLDSLKSQWPDIEFRTGPLDIEWLGQVDELVVSPGVSLQCSALIHLANSGYTILGDAMLFRREVTEPIVAITGSNAKSTVTSLVGAMLQASGMRVAVGGNLGTPMLELLSEQAEAYVLELSSFQLESTTRLRAKVATMLNLVSDHLDRHATVEQYAKIKQRVYQGCEIAVFNRDDPYTQPLVSSDTKIVSFGSGEPQGPLDWGVSIRDEETWLCRGSRRILNANQLQLKGRHNAVNVLAAMAIVESMGVAIHDKSPVLEAVREFTSLPHRCEWVTSIDNVAYINDSKGTNVGATVAAINGFSTANAQKLIVILGGQGKGADFSPLIKVVAEFVKLVIVIGEDAAVIEHTLNGCADLKRCMSISEAVAAARSSSEPGDTVLLSPACASFDMFDDFTHRGDAFKQCVLQLNQVAS